MNQQNQTVSPRSLDQWANQAAEYTIDALQRSTLFLDVLRKRGNNFIEHLAQGQPPVLTFDYEMVCNGRDLDPPVNFALVHIIGHRSTGSRKKRDIDERRYDPHPEKEHFSEDPTKRPIVIIDPRAGHGPGIGGSKRDSQVGNALSEGHPVYFIIFYTHPIADQTLGQVHEALGMFIEEVVKRHPQAEQPVVIGNCQAGWATALVGADRPDITGPLVFIGAPLSFWANIEGKNPMSYRAGLLGGVWITSFLSDLGKGMFDGASLVAGFEDLNPANTLWTKQYNLYSKVDTEEERYLKFEKWWSGYFLLTDEEIHFIIDSLFVGNKLEMGTLECTPGRRIDLSNIEEPVLVFCSEGDNITPPHHALHWIREVYGSVEEIIRQQKVLVYMVHEKVGHLGIFVSRSVATKEHMGIISNIELIRYLPPGLYEMLIEEDEETTGTKRYKVRFEARTVEDLLQQSEGYSLNPPSFRNVAALSHINDRIYRYFISPWVRMSMTEPVAEMIRLLHPLRMQRFVFSDLNPLLWPVKLAAPWAKENRVQRSENNPFTVWEKEISRSIEECLDLFREIRDQTQELMFRFIYENPFFHNFLAIACKLPPVEDSASCQFIDSGPSGEKLWKQRIEEGGFIEGAVRSIILVMNADDLIYTQELEHLKEIVNSHRRFRKLEAEELRQIIIEQSCILSIDQEAALQTLKKLLPRREDREEVLQMAKELAYVDSDYVDEEREMIKKLKQILEV